MYMRNSAQDVNNRDAERLGRFWSYDPLTGVFRWKIDRPRGVRRGDVAGFLHEAGYRMLQGDGERHRAHRVAWLLFYGKWPEGLIDHCNGVRSDNRISNLRMATHQQNMANRKTHTNNRSGAKGVTWNDARRRWIATIQVSGTVHYLGSFKDKSEASRAYTDAATQLFGAFARAEGGCA